jgi:hypothetical protein
MRNATIRGFLAVGVLTAGVFFSGPRAEAQVWGEVHVRVAPPVPRVEVVAVSPGPAWVWVPGYWNWNGRAYVWIGGRYVDADPGFVWVAPRYVHRGPRVVYVRGYWWNPTIHRRYYGHSHFRVAPRRVYVPSAPHPRHRYAPARDTGYYGPPGHRGGRGHGHPGRGVGHERGRGRGHGRHGH